VSDAPATGLALPLVSVIIPTFNRSNVLSYAIRSAIGQRFQDFEVLVIGDACTDDSEGVAAVAGDARLRWHNLEQRYGRQYGPVNVAFGLARGRYVAYLGHDDLWLPNHLEHLVAALEAGQADLAYSAIEMVWGPTSSAVWATDINTEGKREDYFRANFINPSCLVFRRDLVDELGPWLDPAQTGAPADWEFVQRACRAGKQFAFVPVLTSLKFPSWTRPGVYEERPCNEQAARWELIQRYGDGYAHLAYQRALAELETHAPVQAREIEILRDQLAAVQQTAEAHAAGQAQELEVLRDQLAAVRQNAETHAGGQAQELEVLRDQLAAVQTEAVSLRQEISALRRSLTWRATEPIRRAFAWLPRWR